MDPFHKRAARFLRHMMATPRFTKPALAGYPDYVLRPRSCEVCSSRENLEICKNCLVTYYCSQEHKASDLERHTEKCRYMGFHWLLPPICEHEQNRQTLSKVDIMLHLFPSTAAAEISQIVLLTMHWRRSYTFGLCRGRPSTWDDKTWQRLYAAIADFIPVIDVRQGRDDEAYRFIYQETHHSAPWLDIERRNTGYPRHFADDEANTVTNRHRSFEEIQKHTGLGHQVLLTLMAIKALRSVQDVENISTGLRGTYVRGNAVPQETIDNICEYLGIDFLVDLFGVDLSRATWDVTWRRNKIREMRWVVTKCVYETARTNKHIWRLILDTNRLEARREFGQFSLEAGWDVEKMAEVVAIRQYQVWMETPGSFDILRRAMAAAARWASVEGGICWPIERLRDSEDVAAMPEVYHYDLLLRTDSGYESGFE